MALQGAFREHVRALEACGARTRLVRLPADLEGLDGLVIPGGESTTMTMLMERMELWEPVRQALVSGLPTLGTCAGLIVMAERVLDGLPGQPTLHSLDVAVRRNGYGRQLDSFEADVDLEGEATQFPGVFIRAPVLVDTGAARVVAWRDGRPVGVVQGGVMGLAFHPELSGDVRLHLRFLDLISARGAEAPIAQGNPA